MLRKNPDITIIILTLNGSIFLEHILKSISCQSNNLTYEIIIIDSGSTDKTIEIAQKNNISHYRIDHGDFNYGLTKNFAVHISRSKYCVFLSQDAIPLNDKWLQNLINPLINDDNIAGTFSRQIVNPNIGCNSLEEININNSFPLLDKIYTKNDIGKLVFSNVSSSIRRNLLIKFPFKNVPFAEDKIWANEIIQHGYKLKYVTESIVLHSHNHNLMVTLKKAIDNGAVRRIFSGFNFSLKSFLNKTINPIGIYLLYKRYKESFLSLEYSKKDSFAKYYLFYSINSIGGIIGTKITYKRYLAQYRKLNINLGNGQT